MQPTRGFLAVVLVLALGLGVVASLSPWWSIQQESAGGGPEHREAGPFDSGDSLIDRRTAGVSGVLLVVATVAIGGAALLVVLGFRPGLASLDGGVRSLAIAGASFCLLAMVYAVFAYPIDYGPAAAFWGGRVATSQPTGFTRADAAYGWYLTGACALMALAGAFLARRPAGASMDGAASEDAAAAGTAPIR